MDKARQATEKARAENAMNPHKVENLPEQRKLKNNDETNIKDETDKKSKDDIDLSQLYKQGRK